MSCHVDRQVKAAIVQAVPLVSEEHGDLIDDRRWQIVQHVMKEDTVDAILFTPPTSTFVLQSIGDDPALRDSRCRMVRTPRAAFPWEGGSAQGESVMATHW